MGDARPANAPPNLVTSIPVGGSPGAVAFDPHNGNLFVVNVGTDNVSVIGGSTNTVVASIPLGPTCFGHTVGSSFAAYDPANGMIYVSDGGNDNVTVINGATDSVVATLGGTPGGAACGTWIPGPLAVDPSNGTVYVASADNLSEIGASTNQWVAYGALAHGAYPFLNGIQGVAFDNVSDSLYVGGQYGPHTLRVYQIDPSTLGVTNTSTWDAAPSGPSSAEDAVEGMVFDASNGDLYVGTQSNQVPPMPPGVFVLDTGTGQVVSRVATGGGTPEPVSSALDAANDLVLTLSNNDSTTPCTCNVDVLSGRSNSLFESFPDSPSGLLGDPVGVAFDPANGRIYITGNISSSSGIVAVWSLPAFSVHLQPSNPGTDVGAAVTFLANVSGGLWGAPDTYAFSESTASAGCTFSGVPAADCTPTSAGSFNVSVRATDSGGEVATATSTPVTVAPELRVNLTASNATPLLGQTVAFVTNATGGVAPYNYTYSGFPPGCVSEDKPAVGCLPTQADYYNVTVQVRDSNNVTRSANATIHVIFDFNVVVPTNTSAGSPFTIRVNTNETFSGGTGLAPAVGFGSFTYNYTGLPPGCASQDVARLTCTPTQTGTYRITVAVHDQIGDHNAHTVAVNVVPAPGTSSAGFLGLSGETGDLVLGGAIAIAAILVSVLVLRRQGRSRPRAPIPTGGPGTHGKGRASDEAGPFPDAAGERTSATPAGADRSIVAVSRSDWEEMKSRLDKLEKKGP